MGKIKIAMIGQRGIPARYGGVETHVEHLSTRLVDMGHDVTVFCRRRFLEELSAGDPGVEGLLVKGGEGVYKGVKLVARGSVNTKHLDSATHTLLCSMETALKTDFDLVHFHGIGPSAFAPLPRLAGRVVISTIHALDWRQSKWGKAAGAIMRAGEWAGARSSTGVITVSRRLREYVEKKYRRSARYIPNGAMPGGPRPVHAIKRWGLEGDDYVLAVGRIIRDRGLHLLIAAFLELETDLKLVIVGSENPRTDYSDELEEMSNERVMFTGDVFGDELEELYANCRLYVLASAVEGLPITVCEAMAFGRGLLLSDIPENREVAGSAAWYFNCHDKKDLYDKLKVLLEDSDTLRKLGEVGMVRVREEYNWDKVAKKTERFYLETMNAKRGGAEPSR